VLCEEFLGAFSEYVEVGLFVVVLCIDPLMIIVGIVVVISVVFVVVVCAADATVVANITRGGG